MKDFQPRESDTPEILQWVEKIRNGLADSDIALEPDVSKSLFNLTISGSKELCRSCERELQSKLK